MPKLSAVDLFSSPAKAPAARAGVKAPKLSAVDLFCGSGGLSAGFIDAGIAVEASFDNWAPAIKTYRRNIADHVAMLDLSEINDAVEKVANIRPDIIAGGPPCQDFSTAGKRIEGGRADLTSAFGKIVSECRPRFFLMENVPQARLSNTYKKTRELLERDGYGIIEIVVDASRCGVPQARKRFFAFGSLKKKSAERFMESIDSRLSEKRLTVKEYLKREIDVEFYYRHPRNYSRRSVFSVHEPSPTIRGVNRPVPPGYQGNRLDSAPPSKVRPLTSYERSRIQTFPKSWDWNAGDRNSDAELQIGNAVPVELAAFVARGVIDAASR